MRAGDEPDGVGARGGQAPDLASGNRTLKAAIAKEANSVSLGQPDITGAIAGQRMEIARRHALFCSPRRYLSLFKLEDGVGISQPERSLFVLSQS